MFWELFKLLNLCFLSFFKHKMYSFSTLPICVMFSISSFSFTFLLYVWEIQAITLNFLEEIFI